MSFWYLIGFIVAVLTVLSQVFWWQKKEYRWDRMRSHLLEKNRGRKGLLLYLASGVVLAVALEAHFKFMFGFSEFIAIVLLLCFLWYHLDRINRRGVFRPDSTLKAITLLMLSFLLLVAFIYYFSRFGFLPAVLGSTYFIWLSIPTVAVAVFINNIPYYFKKISTIAKAKNMRQESSAIAVGITGSYGKTSTKYFLQQMLEKSGKSHDVTSAHVNSPYPVALDMLKSFQKKLEFYVAEMAAYKVGEIKQLAEIVSPKIGVVTAIGRQHLSLFKNQERLAAAKWELIDSLPSDGVAVLNFDDAVIQGKAKDYRGKTIWYSIEDRVDVCVSHYELASTETKIALNISGVEKSISIPLAGVANMTNAVAAAATAYALGIDRDKIFEALGQLKAAERTMEIKSGKNGSQVIDDSYSANEKSVAAGVEQLLLFPQKNKVILYDPIIELGSSAADVERDVDQLLKSAEAKVYITTEYYPKKLATTVKSQLDKDTVVLMEGRVPELVRKAVLA